MISWIRNNLRHGGKKERGKEIASKGVCNCSQDCIAEVEREGPRGGHEGGKRTVLCVRRYMDIGTVENARVVRVRVYVRAQV